MNASSWVGFAALLLATVVSTWFMIVYSFRGPWWKPSPDDPHGEHRAHLGYFTLNLTLIFYLYDFRPLIDPGVFGWLRSGLFSLIALNLTWRLWLLLRPARPRLAEVPST
jgi:hypothetical protein